MLLYVTYLQKLCECTDVCVRIYDGIWVRYYWIKTTYHAVQIGGKCSRRIYILYLV